MKKYFYSLIVLSVLITNPTATYANWHYYFQFDLYFDNYGNESQQFFQRTIQLKLKNNHYLRTGDWDDIYGTGNYEEVSYFAAAEQFQNGTYFDWVNFRTWEHDTSSILGINLESSYSDQGIIESFSLNDTLNDLEELLIPGVHQSNINFDYTPHLKRLNIEYGDAWHTNISNLNYLEYINCHYNKLSLQDLYFLSSKISDPLNKILGQQNPFLPYHERDIYIGDTINFSGSHFINGIQTTYEIKHEGEDSLAKEGIDYTVTNGYLIFSTPGAYNLTRTNSAITSHPAYPAYEKYRITIQENMISWDWKIKQNTKKTVISNATGDDTPNNSSIGDRYYFIAWTKSTKTPTYGYRTDGIADTLNNNFSYLNTGDTVNSRFVQRHRYPKLKFINLSNQEVININITSNLDSINLDSNQLSLTELYNVLNKLDYPENSVLGIQTHEAQVITLSDSVNIEENYMVNQTLSRILVLKDGVEAAEEFDYTINGGIIKFLTAGKYTIEITNPIFASEDISERRTGSNSPSVKYFFTVDQPVSLKLQNDQAGILVYPNPSMGLVLIKSYHFNIVGIQIFNVFGKLMKEQKNINASSIKTDLPAEEGVYIISVETEQSNFSFFKLIKTN